MNGLTSKQREILNFIHSFIEQHHYSPSYREIMDHFSFSSPGSVYKYIQLLKNKGVLNSEKHSHRSILPIAPTQVVKESTDLHLPLIGNLSAGYPLELFAQHQMLTIPSYMIHNAENTYILQIQGNSLKEDSILHGDFILIEARQEIQPGEIILGIINHHDTVLKRYFPEGQSIRLESQHSQENPLNIRSDHILIQGVLVGILRLF